MKAEDYWMQDAVHQDQKFYTALCLLHTACNDYAIGLELLSQKKLDWAATALYYSIVHSGRLVCFLALSDFPTGHEDLVSLLEQGTTKKKSKTWMKQFRNKIRAKVNIDLPEYLKREDIVNFFEENNSFILPEIDSKLISWGQILSQGRKLRNDSNYEGLLIAHQYNHHLIQSSFTDLNEAFSKSSQKVLKESIDFLITFIESSSRKQHWYSLLNDKDVGELDYIYESLDEKIQDKIIIGEIKKMILYPLQNNAVVVPVLAHEAHKNITYTVFGEKGNLMREFKRDISGFKTYVDSDYTNHV